MLPGREPERMPQQVAEIRRGCARSRRKRNVARARKRAEWRGLRGPVEIARRPRKRVEVVLGAVVIAADDVDARRALQYAGRSPRSPASTAEIGGRWSSPEAAARARSAPASATRA